MSHYFQVGCDCLGVVDGGRLVVGRGGLVVGRGRGVVGSGLVVGGGRGMVGSGLMVSRSRGVVPETRDNINNMAKILQDPTTCTI